MYHADTGFAYVCNSQYEAKLLMSIASWSRFEAHPVFIVDLGLTSQGKDALNRLETNISYLPAANLDIPGHVPNPSKVRAFYEKTRAGLHQIAKRLVFLDADTIVTSPEFLNIFAAITPSGVLACPSAQDKDFTWTYNASCQETIRSLTSIDAFTLTWEIVNSGVWAASENTARVLCAEWSQIFERVVRHEFLWRHINPGRSIGDQEFMLLSATKLGIPWQKLHGSYNMHLDDKQMAWQQNRGGHFTEQPEIVKAVHYGAELTQVRHISDLMIADPGSRAFLDDQYHAVRKHLLREAGKASVSSGYKSAR